MSFETWIIFDTSGQKKIIEYKKRTNRKSSNYHFAVGWLLQYDNNY